MNPSRDLRRLERTGQRKLRVFRIRSVGIRRPGLISSADSAVDAMAAMLCINLLNFWSNWVRAYFISCVTGARSGDRRFLSNKSNLATVDEAIEFAILLFRKNAAPTGSGAWRIVDEPAWFDERVILKCSQCVGLSNYAKIAASFSFGFGVFRELRIFRNYFAHRNRDRFEEAMALAPSFLIGGATKPAEIVRAVSPGESVSTLERWIDELDHTISSLCG
jgi:hypothetical protein